MNSIWDIINIPMGYVIRFCNTLVGNNYFFALLLFAVIIEIVLLPFGIKQQKNSIKQARLRPKEMAIRKKYAGREDQVSKQKMSQEIQEFYQKEGYNPMGGCLPMLIQFPIIIALYNIVMDPLHYICGLSQDAIGQVKTIVEAHFPDVTYDAARNINLLNDMQKLDISLFSGVEGFADKIPSFDALPNVELFGGAINLAQTPSITSFNWLLLVPILTFAAYFFSMKMTRKLTYQPAVDDKAMGCSNKMMDIMMPLFSVYISFVVPAAIGVYWIFKSLLGVVKQFILKHAMPIPTFTEEDYKAAEKAVGTLSDKPRKKSGKVVRSLHHIDDEDFEDTREAAIARRNAMEAETDKADNSGKEEAPKTEDAQKNSLLSGVSLKSEADKKAKEKKTKKEKKSQKDEYVTSDGSDKHDKSEK